MAGPSSRVRERLRTLVDVVFQGNVLAAARGAGVEPSTMHRILEADVVEPRLSTVARLADGFGVTVAWLAGEVSATQLQREDDVLPEPLWLIQSYHRRKQTPLRSWLRDATAKSPQMAQMLNDLAHLAFDPLRAGFPVPAISVLLRSGKRLNDRDVAIFRHCAEFETEILQLAVQKIRKTGFGRGGDDK